jgi:2-polyprenyl-6-methoxyphenol hydroxylase-like FAD-dependent oxidoreductase
VPPWLIAALRAAEPLGTVSAQHYPTSTWRRYDKLRRFPPGLLVIGDAICSFNPIYGQGMTVAALQALALRDCLADPDSDVSKRFFRATTKRIAPVWRMNRLTDFALSQGNSWRAIPQRLVRWRFEMLQAATANDPVVAETMLRVLHLVDPPTRLLHPGLTMRMIAANRRSRSSTQAP